MSFKNKLILWMEEALSGDIPEEVCAFSFNLFQPARVENVKFGIQLVGCDKFDEKDDYWPCNEIWEPKNRNLYIPIKISGESWEDCQDVMLRELKEILNMDYKFNTVLKSKLGIGLGFVDGDLFIIFKRG